MLKVYPEQVKFIEGFNHSAVIRRYEAIKTVGDAYSKTYVKLFELKQIYTENTPIFLIESWLNNLAMILGLPVLDEQVKELAFLIYEEVFFLNIAELTLLFKYIKKGKYGSFYGRIDPAEILRWCRAYRQERGNYISKLPDHYESKVLNEAKEQHKRLNQNNH